jgi:hypothetical protein
MEGMSFKKNAKTKTHAESSKPALAGSDPVKKLTLIELLDSWEPLSDEDAMPQIDKLETKPFNL